MLVAACTAVLPPLAPSHALAAAGSGLAHLAPSSNAAAGSAGTWTVTYVAEEDFAWPNGGIVRIQIPPGWTAPQTGSASQSGFVTVTDPASVKRVTVAGNTIEIELGSPPKSAFLAGDSIRVVYGSGGGSAAAAAQAAPGIATFLVSSDPSGNAPSPIASSPLLAVDAGPPSHLTVSPDTLRLRAGVPDTVVAFVRDTLGNRTPLSAGETLTLWTDRPGGRFRSLAGITIFQVTIPAGADSAAFVFLDTQAQGAPGRIEIIDTNGSGASLGAASAPVVTDPNVPAGSVSLTVAPDTLVADGASSATVVSGVIRDAWGNAVAGGELFTARDSLASPQGDVDPGTPGVQWAVLGGGTLSGTVRANTTPGADSVVVLSLSGTARGARAIRLVAGPPAGSVALVATPDSVAADGASTLPLTASGLTDAAGNPVEDNEPYTVATTLGSIASPDEDPSTPGIQARASGGALAFTLLGGDSLGVATVSVTSVRGSASGSVPVRLVPGGIDGTRSTAVAASPADVGPVGSVLTVTLRDARDHALAGVPADSMEVAVSGVAASIVPLASATGAAGGLDFRVTATSADTALVAVTARGVLLEDRPAIVFQPGPLDTLVVTGPAGPLEAGAPDSFQVAARDAFGNAIPALDGTPLLVGVVAGAASVPGTVPLSSGTATVPFTPTLAQPLAIEVSDGAGETAAYGPVGVSAGAAYRLLALPLASGSDTLAAGDSISFRARVEDALGNAVAGSAVGAAVIAGSGTVTPATGLTDVAGEALFRLTAGSAPGALGVRLLALASAAPDSARADTVLVTVVPGATASLQVVPDSLTWRAGDSVRVVVRALDAFGNTVVTDGAAVTMTPSGSVSWSPPSGPFAAGEFVTYGRDTVSESISIGAARAAGGISGSGGIAIVRPASPERIETVAGMDQSAVVDRELPLPLRVRARDTFGNAVPATAVLFRVTAGGGSLDATRGGATDSVGVTDGSGIAGCEVVRLGLAAGAGSDSVEALLLASPAARVSFGATALPDTVASIALAPPSLSIEAAASATVTASARDRFGNPTPGASVTFYLGAPALGTLESMGETSGGPGSQSGAASALGTVSVRYRAPSTAPAADSIFARGATLPPTGIAAAVGSATTASLRVEPDLTDWIAGAPVRVRVRAVDAFGNPVPTDGTLVTMSSTGAVSWSPPSGPLVAGEFETFARDTVAQTVASLQATTSGGASGSAGPVVVRPAPPAGAIPIVASRTTLTADGRSTASVTLGPVRDTYGNAVAAGTLVDARTGSATLVGPDASSLDSLQLATGVDGRASLVLVAPSVPGPDLLRLSSGAASGSVALLLEPPPSITASAESLAPGVVVPGLTYAFSVPVTNSGTGTIQLAPGTTLSFGPAAGAFTAPLSGSVSIPQGQTAALAFAATAVPGTLTPGTYAPALRAVGLDGTGEPFDFYPSLAGAQVHAAGISVAAVGASPSTVPLGYADLSLVFDVANPTALAATVDAASLGVSAGAFTVSSVTPPLPAPLPAGGTLRLTLSVRVPSSGLLPGTVLAAQLTATASFGGSSVTGVNAAPLSFSVESAARIAAVPGGAAPSRYLRSRSFAPMVLVENTGTTAVTLSRAQTRLVLEHPGGDLLSAGLRAATAVAGGDQAALAFDSLAVPAAAARGSYGARLILAGTESGQAFADTIPLAPDSVSVLEPPVLAVPGPIVPAVVSAGQARPLRISVANSGDVDFEIDAATTLRLEAPLSVALALAAPAVVPAGGSVNLDFAGASLGSPAFPGIASATLEARGREDGTYREAAVPAGVLDARAPASLSYVAGSVAPDTVRAGEVHDVTLLVRNEGGSPFTLDPAASRLHLSDGVEQVVAMAAGAPFSLDPAGQAVLSFPAVTFPAALASQPYPITLVLQGAEWGHADSAMVASAGPAIAVIEEAAAIQVRAFDAGAPPQVAGGAADVRLWGIELTPLVPEGTATAARLHALRLRVVADGSEAPSASANFASISLRDASGALLAQAAGGVANPVRVDLVPPLPLSSGAESLLVEVTLAGVPAAHSLSLRIAVEPDVVVLDDLTGTPVPIRAGGGLAFAALTSPALTLFDRAHGYPNPFRAGREAVQLSYLLPDDAAVRITIYTLLGGVVREMALSAGAPGGARGLNEVAWDGRNGQGELVRPGVYVARIEGGGASERVKVGVLR